MFSSLQGTDFIPLSITLWWIISSPLKRSDWSGGLCQRREKAQCRGLLSPAALLRRSMERGGAATGQMPPTRPTKHYLLQAAAWSLMGCARHSVPINPQLLTDGSGPTPALHALHADPSCKALPWEQTNSPCSSAAQLHWTKREVRQLSKPSTCNKFVS